MSRLVVLGAGGFIGKHLVRRLAKTGRDAIVAFGNFSNFQLGAENPFADLANVTVVPGNFLNRDEVASVLEKADYVFHLVSSTNPAVSSKDPFVDIDTNVRSSIELLELCVERGVKRVLFPSSGGSIYGNTGMELINEQVVPQPFSPYGIGKLTIEHYLRYFKHTSGLDYIVYRVANPYGPGQNVFGKQGIIPIFMYKSLLGEPVMVYGDGSMVRDYLYIDDLIEMIACSYDKPHKYNEYNLGSGTGHSVNDILGALRICADKKIHAQHVPTPPTFVAKSVLDISRFEEEFGKQEFTDLSVGMERTWQYVKHLG